MWPEGLGHDGVDIAQAHSGPSASGSIQSHKHLCRAPRWQWGTASRDALSPGAGRVLRVAKARGAQWHLSS